MSELIEVKTVELDGEALAWAVGKAEGLTVFIADPQYGNPHRVMIHFRKEGCFLSRERYKPHQDWSQGGLLIEKHAAMVRGFPNQMYETLAIARVRIDGSLAWRSGLTPLIALCRAIVSARLGETVSVPRELVSCA